MKVILRWNFPGHDGDAVADGYRVFVNQKQYGGDLSIHTNNALIEVSENSFFCLQILNFDNNFPLEEL